MNTFGQHMRAEIAQAADVFGHCYGAALSPDSLAALAALDLGKTRAFYTIARGSSDAAANILSYEVMRETGKAMTSLPPSIFSLGRGVDMAGTVTLVVSQSGASDDLVRSARGVRAAGGVALGLVNATDSPVSKVVDLTLPINAGPEIAVPATKSVIGAIAAGMALLGYLEPNYFLRAAASVQTIAKMRGAVLPDMALLVSALLRAQHVYIIGRDSGFGAAQELALKLKETCAIYAEAYSSSEVLHGPFQLVTKPLLVLILDTDQADIQASLDVAEARFRASGATVYRLRASDVGAKDLTPAAAAALLLYLTYPLVLALALALGLNPDAPATLSKVTQTR
jgi:glucosamine--fructose-6-phosphate aminotransferase (isomerizing)